MSSASSRRLVAASERATPKRARDESGAIARRVAIRAIGFVEESGRPQRVAIQRDRFWIAGRERSECLGFAPGPSELGDLQRRANRAFARANGQLGIGGLRRLIEGLQRFLVTRLVVEQRRELQLKIGVGVRGPRTASVPPTNSASAMTDAPSPTWYPAQRPHGPTLTWNVGPATHPPYF